MVSGTPGAGVCTCVVATEAEVAISGILTVFEWRAVMVIVSVGHMLTPPILVCVVTMRRTCAATVWVPPW